MQLLLIVDVDPKSLLAQLFSTWLTGPPLAQHTAFLLPTIYQSERSTLEPTVES